MGFQSNESFFTTNATVLRSSDDIFANNSWVFNQRVHILWGFKPENAEKLSNDSFFTTNATVLRSFDYIFANNFWSFNQRIHISWDFKQGNAFFSRFSNFHDFCQQKLSLSMNSIKIGLTDLPKTGGLKLVTALHSVSFISSASRSLIQTNHRIFTIICQSLSAKFEYTNELIALVFRPVSFMSFKSSNSGDH